MPGLGAGPLLLENPSSPRLKHRPLALHYLVDDTAALVHCRPTHSHQQLTLPRCVCPSFDPLACTGPAALLSRHKQQHDRVLVHRLERPRNRPDYRLDLDAIQLTAFLAAASLSPFISSAAVLRHPIAPASRSALTNQRCDYTPTHPTPRLFTHGPPALPSH